MYVQGSYKCLPRHPARSCRGARRRSRPRLASQLAARRSRPSPPPELPPPWLLAKLLQQLRLPLACSSRSTGSSGASRPPPPPPPVPPSFVCTTENALPSSVSRSLFDAAYRVASRSVWFEPQARVRGVRLLPAAVRARDHGRRYAAQCCPPSASLVVRAGRWRRSAGDSVAGPVPDDTANVHARRAVRCEHSATAASAGARRARWWAHCWAGQSTPCSRPRSSHPRYRHLPRASDPTGQARPPAPAAEHHSAKREPETTKIPHGAAITQKETALISQSVWGRL